MDTKTWIVVADSSEARVFSIPHKAALFNGDGKNLSMVSEHTHADSHKKDSDLMSDKQGKFFAATFQPDTDPHEHEEDVFALEMARVLAKGHYDTHFGELILIAPPKFMGRLCHHFPHELHKVINMKIEKDYTKLNEHEIVKRLQEFL